MRTENAVLTGRHVRLEPLDLRHVDGLVTAAADDASLYQWSPVPQGAVEATGYVKTAMDWRDAGTAMPFAIVRVDNDRINDDRVNDGVVIGSTRFFDLAR